MVLDGFGQRHTVHARHPEIGDHEVMRVAGLPRNAHRIQRVFAGREAAVAHSPTGDLAMLGPAG
jgi:hypothetical protein